MRTVTEINKYEKTILTVFATGFMLLAFSDFAFAQKQKEITVESKPVDASGGTREWESSGDCRNKFIFRWGNEDALR